MVITRTPFRLSLFGGGTDYRAWFENHGGLVIGATFRKYCYISSRPLPPFFDHKTRAVYSKTELVQNNSELQHPSIRACLQYLEIQDGLEIHHDGDLPARAGLGSSSAFTVGFLLCLRAMRHEMPTKEELAEQAIHVEQQILKENAGIQDQILAAHGGLQVVHIDSKGQYTPTPLRPSADYFRALEEHILLGFTGLPTNATELAQAQVQEIQNSKHSRVGEIHSITEEALKLLKTEADPSQIGKLLNESWQIKRSITEKSSNPEIDQLYDVARKAGAYGGHLMGAGGGGFMMLFAPQSQHRVIKEALPEIKVWVPFKFDKSGAQVIMHTDAY
jgi:D-glycero-alpha-D-manno-heptose-7-phosphate kinase